MSERVDTEENDETERSPDQLEFQTDQSSVQENQKIKKKALRHRK